jgi:hypothetical protein
MMQNSETLETKIKSFISFIQKLVIAFASMCAIMLGLYLAYNNEVGSAVTCLTTGIVLFIFSNLDLFESIKAPGIEAKMRTIDAKVQEVQALAKKVANTSSVTAAFCMQIMVRIGRMSGPLPRGQAFQLVSDMREQLLSLDVDEAAMSEIMAPWNEIISNDLIGIAYTGLRDSMLLVGQQIEAKLHSLPKPINVSDLNYLAYMAEHEKFGELSHFTLNYHDVRAAQKAKKMRSLYRAIIGTYGPAAILRQNEVTQAMDEAEHFLQRGEFRTQQFWLDHDPMAPAQWSSSGTLA